MGLFNKWSMLLAGFSFLQGFLISNSVRPDKTVNNTVSITENRVNNNKEYFLDLLNDPDIISVNVASIKEKKGSLYYTYVWSSDEKRFSDLYLVPIGSTIPPNSINSVSSTYYINGLCFFHRAKEINQMSAFNYVKLGCPIENSNGLVIGAVSVFLRDESVLKDINKVNRLYLKVRGVAKALE